MKKTLLSILTFSTILLNQKSNAQTNAGLHLDGVDDVINTPLNFNSSIYNNWTYECWVNSPASPNNTEHNGPMYGQNMAITWDHVNPTMNGAASIHTSTGYHVTSFGTLNPNTWYHLAATWDGTTLKAYKNGNLESSVIPTGTFVTDPGTLSFGKHPTLSQFWNGTIDEARVWTVARTCTEINQNMNTTLTGNETGLKAYYNFNSGTPNGTNTSITSIPDQTSASNTATLSGFSLTGTSSNFISGSPFNALLSCGASTGVGLHLDGVNDVINTPLNFNSTIYNNWTYECWVNSPASPNNNEHNGPMYGENMAITWDHMNPSMTGVASIHTSTGYHVSSFGTLDPNTWYHLAATWDGTTLKAYKNGNLESSVVPTGSFVTDPGTLSLGKHPTLSQFWNGTIDEARVWTVARTCAEINQNMNTTLTGNETGLKAYYNFNSGTPYGINSSITTVSDQTSAANTASLSGFALMGSSSNFVSGSPFNATLNCGATTGINESLSDLNVSIYPNPASSFINIEVFEPTTIELMNVLGDIIKSETINKQSKIDVSNLSTGIYFIKEIKSGKAIKFIKD